jgi:hypothetical protein
MGDGAGTVAIVDYKNQEVVHELNSPAILSQDFRDDNSWII